MLQRFVVALNAVSSQPWAILVLLIGCGTYLGSKHFGLDTSVPSGIVGAAINMLTNHTATKTDTTQTASGEPVTVQTTESPSPTFSMPDSK